MNKVQPDTELRKLWSRPDMVDCDGAQMVEFGYGFNTDGTFFETPTS